MKVGLAEETSCVPLKSQKYGQDRSRLLRRGHYDGPEGHTMRQLPLDDADANMTIDDAIILRIISHNFGENTSGTTGYAQA